MSVDPCGSARDRHDFQKDFLSPAADPQAPYARIAVAGLVRRKGGDGDPATWLLLHRTEPIDAWDPPGGRMEYGEDLSSAVVREVFEETGLTVQVAGPCYALLTVYKGERVLVVSAACRPVGEADRGAHGARWGGRMALGHSTRMGGTGLLRT